MIIKTTEDVVMNDNEATETNKSELSTLQSQDTRPRSLKYYLYSSKNSKKVGNIATTGYFQLKEMLRKDIPIPSVQDMSEAFSNLISKPLNWPSVEKLIRSEKLKISKKLKQENREADFKKAAEQSNEVLAEATTVFPFTLFPDTLTVDRTKLTITQRTFFRSSRVVTIHIEDVLNLSVQVGPLFGALTIALKGLTSEDHISMNYFWRKDAIHLKHIIQGHTIARRDELDYKNIERPKLIETLIELGRDSNS